MDYVEAQAVIPVSLLFDKYIAYCQQEPLHVDNTTITRSQIVDMVKSAKLMSSSIEASTGFPAYDVFAFTVRNINNKLLEGRGPCAFDPVLCVWAQNGTTILRSLYQAKGGR